ncbi:hypothetical protein ACWATR_40080 [Nostoc sp. UIC 10890]
MTAKEGITPNDLTFEIMSTLGRYEETITNLQTRLEAQSLEQKRIVEKAYQLQITPDDLTFRMMATLGRYEESIIDLQARLEAQSVALVLQLVKNLGLD